MQDRWLRRGPLCSCPGWDEGERAGGSLRACAGGRSPLPCSTLQALSPLPLPALIICETLNAEKWKKWLNLFFHFCLQSQTLLPINHSCDCVGPRKLPTKDLIGRWHESLIIITVSGSFRAWSWVLRNQPMILMAPLPVTVHTAWEAPATQQPEQRPPDPRR